MSLFACNLLILPFVNQIELFISFVPPCKKLQTVVQHADVRWEWNEKQPTAASGSPERSCSYSAAPGILALICGWLVVSQSVRWMAR